jgi:hypothetical protein
MNLVLVVRCLRERLVPADIIWADEKKWSRREQS